MSYDAATKGSCSFSLNRMDAVCVFSALKKVQICTTCQKSKIYDALCVQRCSVYRLERLGKKDEEEEEGDRNADQIESKKMCLSTRRV